ncbi:MAG: efflux RND transporter permease subunit [Bacteroidales bacterium]|nr:efflux RND transporter permease subunit [Bacteroidales bacterium]
MKRKSVSPFTIIVTAICLSIVGLAFLPLLPLKLEPSQSLPTISVSFAMQNGTSKIVESEVTSRIEAMLARMNGVNRLYSSSSNGGGYISVSLDKNVDIDAARFEISTLIRQIWPDLPDGVSYPNIQAQSLSENDSQDFLTYTINALADPLEIYDNVDKVFSTSFSDLKGISSVTVSGAQPKEWSLEYDVDVIQKLNITDTDIKNAVSNYRSKQALGKYYLTTNVSDTSFVLSDIRVVLPDSTTVGLDRLVTMKYNETRPTSIFRINGLNSIYLEIKSTKEANQIALQQQVVERIKQLKNKLPHGYEMHKIHDTTEYISKELDKIYYRSGLTVLILLVFVWLTTFSWRHVVVVTCSLACNLAIAVLAYYMLGVELQLYSLAGITISLNLIIDNTIIMADHWRREHNLLAILPIVAATLTTIGALSIVFFLDDRLRLNLYDFAVIMIVNLLISIFIALWFVPSLLKIQREKTIRKLSLRRLRLASHFNRGYQRFVSFTVRHKKLAILLVIWGFGLPLFLMPKEIQSESKFATAYNTVFGSKVYQENIRPYTDVIFGGALRLFVEKVYNGSYWSRNNDVVLYVYASLPYGSTIEQMDERMRRMESFLSQYKEVRQFITQMSAQQGSIQIYFTDEAAHSSFPYMLKSNIISKALQLGDGSWDVYGLQDQGFSNNVSESNGSYMLRMSGYNYDRLYEFADSVKAFLLTHKRIKEVNINPRRQYYKSDYMEYHLKPNTELMAQQGISASYLFYVLQQSFKYDNNCGFVWSGNRKENIKLYTRQSDEYNIWSLLNKPVEINGREYKINQLCSFEKEQAPEEIVKENQQYQLCLQYEYIGSGMMGDRVSHEADSIYTERLPIGYKISYDRNYYSWGSEESKQYWLLGLVLTIIVFITSILFNSLKMPIIIIGIIPISYIGLFLTFYLFSLNFDQGGLAALILLCGITVNASIYIVNEYKKRCRHLTKRRAYLKAFNVKIIPILLTVLSTVLGFIPFMLGEQKEAFWFPLAAGTIGGLLMSLVGIFIFLPAFTLRRKSVEEK